MAALGFIFDASLFEPKQTTAPVDREVMDKLRNSLTASIRELAVSLLGEPNKARSSSRALRWGSKGSLSVPISGPKKGLWYSHETGKGGDPLGLIQHERGGSFLDAVQFGLHFAGMPDHTNGQSDGRTDEQREADRIAREAARATAAAATAIEAEADLARRIGEAHRIAAKVQPLAGTLGETYLNRTRGIPTPSSGWPACVGYYPVDRSLVVISTAADGATVAVQRVHLSENAAKEERGKTDKPANGLPRSGFVRLPGPADGPLLICEGPETGLAAWVSTGHETWIALGAMPSPPISLSQGRRADGMTPLRLSRLDRMPGLHQSLVEQIP